MSKSNNADDSNSKQVVKPTTGELVTADGHNLAISIRDNCYYEQNVKLTNFTAYIKNEIMQYLEDGTRQVVYEIYGELENGKPILPLARVSPTEFRKMKWVLDQWPRAAIVNEPVEKNLQKVRQAIDSDRNQTTTQIQLPACGYFSIEGEYAYVYKDGSVTKKDTKQSIKLNPTSDLLQDCCEWRKLSKSDEDDFLDAATKTRSLLGIIEKSAVGLVIITSVFHSLLSHILPIEYSFVFTGGFEKERDVFAMLARSFFNNKQLILPMEWTTHLHLIKNRIKRNNNSVQVIRELYCPVQNKAATIDKIKNALLYANNSEITHSSKVQVATVERNRINVMVISTAQFPPTNFPIDLHQKLIYVPVTSKMINYEKYDKCREYARNGVFQDAACLFVGYLLREKYTDLKDRLLKMQETIIDEGREQGLDGNRLQQYTYMKVAFLMYIEYCQHFDVMDKATARKCLKSAESRIIDLLNSQNKYTKSPELKPAIIQAILSGLADDHAYLVDYLNNEYVYVVNKDKRSRTATLEREPISDKQLLNKEDRLGWYNAKNKAVYISSEFDLKRLQDWIRNDDIKDRIKSKESGFWIQMDEHGVIASRGSRRIVKSIKPVVIGKRVNTSEQAYNIEDNLEDSTRKFNEELFTT